jgi:hypothetical protein
MAMHKKRRGMHRKSKASSSPRGRGRSRGMRSGSSRESEHPGMMGSEERE